MNEQVKIRNILEEHFLDSKTKNPSFSLRAFAKKLRISPPALSEILNGKRRVSKEMATRLADNLLLDPIRREELLVLFPEKETRDSKYKNFNRAKFYSHQIQANQYALLSDWVHFALLSLIKTADFESNPAWMAGRLGVSTKKVESALKNLMDQSLIEQDEKGNYKRTVYSFSTTEDIENLAIKKAHLNDLEIIKEKMSLDVASRDFTSFTMPTDPSLLGEARKVIRRAQEDINIIMEKGERTEVYRMCSYLFPLTHTKTKQKKISKENL